MGKADAVDMEPVSSQHNLLIIKGMAPLLNPAMQVQSLSVPSVHKMLEGRATRHITRGHHIESQV